jgi:signal transduction histidine kinase
MASYVVLALAAVIGLPNMRQAGQPWWLAACLLLALGVLTHRWPVWQPHLSMAVEIALLVGLMLLRPDIFAMLGFSFSARTMSMFPNYTGALWLMLLILTTGATHVHHDGWIDGLLLALVFAAAYYAFGFYNYAWVQTEAARRKSQILLQEQQAAHRQLQAYAEQAEKLAVVEERNRLAREMHDTLGHRLTVAAVQLEGAQRLVSSDPERAERIVGTVRDQVREALGELRGTVAALRAPVEADFRLRRALTRLASDFEGATGLAVHQIWPEDIPALPATHRQALYRAAQEALTNVQRHAQASQVWLVLAAGDGAVSLLVSDDGVGFPPDDAVGAGFGLRGLRERATQLDGELYLEARPGGGAQLSFRLPLPEQET